MSELRADIGSMLATAGLDPDAVADLARRALEEDLDGGVDVTSVATVPADQRSVLDLVARRPGVAAGVPVAAAVFYIVNPDLDIRMMAVDGARVEAGDVLVSVSGPTRALLQAERPALNLLSHLSGIATLTRSWVDAVARTSAQIRDTRKTTPGMRRLEKYAVRCGGGTNHRMSLSDAALVKDTHVVAAGGVAAAFDAVRRQFP
jgi:nicotinate-nucleotide pyrophosphorylase (carboxylating)